MPTGSTPHRRGGGGLGSLTEGERKSKLRRETRVPHVTGAHQDQGFSAEKPTLEEQKSRGLLTTGRLLLPIDQCLDRPTGDKNIELFPRLYYDTTVKFLPHRRDINHIAR